MTDKPVHEWAGLDEDGLRQWATQYVGWATNEMSDPDHLAWHLEEQFPLSEFRSIQTDWRDYFEDDVRGNPRYSPDFEDATWHTPIVISLEDDEIIIWDGWHRIATSMVREDECIMAIVGSQKSVPHS